jgi:drug/metabolite transporter (DMT)-like permease
MPMPFLGETLAIVVSFCWAASSSSFERAGLRVGSLQVNFLRLLMAFAMLGIYGVVSGGSFVPTGATAQQWLWLSVSGAIGFFIGDLFLFQSLTIIGARLTMLVMTFSPALTALIGMLWLGEKMSWNGAIGILLIIAGILMAFLGKRRSDRVVKTSLKGLLLALGGAFGQAFGLIFSKKGIGDYDPFAATQIRIIAGFVLFALMVTVLGKWSKMHSAVKDSTSMKQIAVGSFFGPGLGVGLSMAAISMTDTGIASALMSLTPIVLVGLSLIKRRPVTLVEILGALVSVGGVLLLFLA